ncbi:MAG: hypothetical protein U0531_18200 [Dehalococcoidia bacterium]
MQRLHQGDEAAARQAAVIEAQQRTISDLQTPVIQVWSGILALPIAGSVDTARAQEMNERLLDKIIETGSEIVILDITGVLNDRHQRRQAPADGQRRPAARPRC